MASASANTAPNSIKCQCLLQIHGRKSFTIFPPRDLTFLLDSKGYVSSGLLLSTRFSVRAHSPVLSTYCCLVFMKLYRFADLSSPDTIRFPFLSKASARQPSVTANAALVISAFLPDYATRSFAAARGCSFRATLLASQVIVLLACAQRFQLLRPLPAFFWS